MGLYMRAVLRTPERRPFIELERFVEAESDDYHAISIDGRGWAAFEIEDGTGEPVLAGDRWVGSHASEELAELVEMLDDLDGSPAARQRLRSELTTATAVVGLQVLMSRYDDSVAAANLVIAFLEQQPGVLTQVDTVGWYDGPELLLADPN